MEQRCYEKVGDFVERCIAGETLLVPVTSGVADLEAIFVLNGTAAVVWEALDGNTPVTSLVDSVASTFDVSAEDARRDVAEFLTNLERDGLVRVRAAPAGA